MNTSFLKKLKFWKFCFVGGSGVGINMGCFWLFRELFQVQDNISLILAIEVSIIWNFVLNYSWTWREFQNGFLSQLLRYHAGVIIGAVINFIFATVLSVSFGVQNDVSNFIGILFGTIFNFFINDRWTFAKPNEK